jgi:hypothetical protein
MRVLWSLKTMKRWIHEAEGENETVTQMTGETEPKSTDIVEVHDDVTSMTDKHYEVDSKSADTVTLMNEQIRLMIRLWRNILTWFDAVTSNFLFVMVYCIDAVRSMETRLNNSVRRRKESKLF